MNEASHFLYLNDNVIRFQPVPDPLQSSTSVFYDEGNRQIFVVKNRGLDGITVKGPENENEITFTLSESSEIHSIKFSPSCSILAIQRSFNTVNFYNFNNNQPGKEYTHVCKAKNSRILGICWTSTCEIVIITDSSVEFCRLNNIRRSIRSLRVIPLSINWFIFNHQTNFLLVAMGSSSTVMQSLQFTTGSVFKLSKFEVEINSTRPRAGSLPERKRALQERDVCLTTLYGKLRLLVFRQDSSFGESNSNSSGNYNCGAQIAIYSFVKDSTPRITHILELELTGRFAINIIDNLVIFHHQTSQTSLIFDIRSKVSSIHGSIPHLKTLIPPFTIKKCNLTDITSIEMYSHKWAVFHPNIIIDASIGCLWCLELDLEAICNIMTQSATLVDFLILRRNSKYLLVKITRDALLGQLWSSNGRILGTISELFDKLNQAWKCNESSKSDATKAKEQMHEPSLTTLDQSEMINLVFDLLALDESRVPNEFGASVFLEYIHSLSSNGIVIDFTTYERFVEYLIECNMINHLQQFLQFQVYEDSKELASLLLKCRKQVKNGPQLALDMLKRLNIPAEEMIDVFLSLDPPANILRALRYASTPQQAFDAISARKFLQVAKDADDEIFYTTFKLFQQRNLRTRGCIDFSPGEQCDHLVAYYKSRFTHEILEQYRNDHDDQIDIPSVSTDNTSS